MSPAALRKMIDAMLVTLCRRAKIDIKLRPKFRVEHVKCGRWSSRTNILTFPIWLGMRRDEPYYFEYYVAHELAHWIVGKTGHGQKFQETLSRIAPTAWHWESTYKPTLYAAELKRQRGNKT